MVREVCAEFFHFGGLLLVRQRAVRLERLVRLAHRHQVGQHRDAEVAEDGADCHQPAQSAQRAW